jgi:hypothetical protein
MENKIIIVCNLTDVKVVRDAGSAIGIKALGWDCWIPKSQIVKQTKKQLVIECKPHHTFKLQKYKPKKDEILTAEEFKILVDGADNLNEHISDDELERSLNPSRYGKNVTI